MSDWRKVPCPTCGAKVGDDCHVRDYPNCFTSPHKARFAIVYVQMPVEPTRGILNYLMDDPIILPASDEQRARAFYAELLERAKL